MKFEKFAVIPAIATMFDTNEKIDVKAQRKLVEFLLKKEVDGFYIGGATGEAFMMNVDDRKRIISETVSAVGGKVTTIAYTGSIDTKTAIELAKHAENEGADAISSVPPYYYMFSPEEMSNYYRALSESVSIPLIIYNNTNAGLMSLEQVKDNLELPNCIGIKYTSTNHYEMKKIKMISDNKLVFSGVDEMFASALISGVDGAIGTTYNIVPEIFIKIRDAFINNDNVEFMRLSEASIKIISAYIKHSFLPTMKASIEMLGIGKRVVKAPRSNVTDEKFKALTDELKIIKNDYNLVFIELFDLI